MRDSLTSSGQAIGPPGWFVRKGRVGLDWRDDDVAVCGGIGVRWGSGGSGSGWSKSWFLRFAAELQTNNWACQTNNRHYQPKNWELQRNRRGKEADDVCGFDGDEEGERSADFA